MNRQQLVQMILCPDQIPDSELWQLTELQKKFPYCQTLHLLYARKLYTTNSLHYSANLKLTAALNRLTITVKVKCVNKYDDKQSFERSFSRFADYSSSQNLTSVQDALIEEIVNALTEDIFNNAVVNW